MGRAHQTLGYQAAKRFYNNRSQQDLEGSNILGIDGG